MAESQSTKKHIFAQAPTTVVAVDQSYTRCGLAVAINGEVRVAKSILMPRERTFGRRLVSAFVSALVTEYKPDCVIVERVRTFSGGMISIGSIIALGTLITTVIDASNGTPVYSIDTRHWKSLILGTSAAKKEDAVAFAESLGLTIDHDAADAMCMALAPFNTRVNLRQEY